MRDRSGEQFPRGAGALYYIGLAKRDRSENQLESRPKDFLANIWNDNAHKAGSCGTRFTTQCRRTQATIPNCQQHAPIAQCTMSWQPITTD